MPSMFNGLQSLSEFLDRHGVEAEQLFDCDGHLRIPPRHHPQELLGHLFFFEVITKGAHVVDDSSEVHGKIIDRLGVLHVNGLELPA